MAYGKVRRTKQMSSRGHRSSRWEPRAWAKSITKRARRQEDKREARGLL